MNDYYVNVMVGTWSAMILVSQQPDAATAEQQALTILGSKIKNLVLGDTYVIGSGTSTGPTNGYRVVISSGTWSITGYIEEQPNTTTAGQTVLNNFATKINRLSLGTVTAVSNEQATMVTMR